MEPTQDSKPLAKVNQQLYANSKLAELFADECPKPEQGTSLAHPRLTDEFFNQKDPNLAILHEKPHHRLLCMMKLAGYTNREIARESGFTESWISQLMRQPWAVRMMAELMTTSGADSIRGLLKSECIPSIVTLATLRDDPDTPAAVRKSACDSLIQQFLGKPAQQVTVEQKTSVDAESIGELDAEIQRLQAEERQLTGKN